MHRITLKCCMRGLHLPRATHISLRSEALSGPSTLSLQHNIASYSTDPARRPSFVKNLIENIRSEFDKNKEMKESLKKFREEAKKLEDSEALKDARRKFESIEGDSKQTAGALKEQISGLTGKLKESVEDISKNETFKKASELGGNISAKTKEASESIGRAAENISKTSAYQTASSAATNIKDELEGQTLGGMVYKPPRVLRKRKECEDGSAEVIQADEDTTGVELHKDSRFAASWQNFKDNNPVMNKFTDYRSII